MPLALNAYDPNFYVTLHSDCARGITGFDFVGLPDNINCFILSSPNSGAATAKWRKGVCHGADAGNMVLGDGSVAQYNDSRLVKTLLGYDTTTETDDGNLQFYFP